MTDPHDRAAQPAGLPDAVKARLRQAESRLRGPKWGGQRIKRQAEVSRRLRAQGDRSLAIELARRIVRDNPSSALAHVTLSDALVAPPAPLEDLREARVVAEQMLSLRSEPRELNAYARMLHALAVVDEDDASSEARTALAAFVAVSPTERLRFAQQHLRALTNAGKGADAVATASSLARVHRSLDYWSLAHDFACRLGAFDVAAELEVGAAASGIDPSDIAMLAADRCADQGDSNAAREILTELPPERSAAYSRRFLRLLADHGRSRDVLAYLERTRHNLSDRDALLERFDALVAVGRLAEATELIESVAHDALEDVPLLTRLRDDRIARGEGLDALQDDVAQYEMSEALSTARLDKLTSSVFELDDLDRLERLVSEVGTARLLGPLGVYNAARLHYVRRRFEDAGRAIDRLAGTVRHWEGEKLRSRMMLEEGRHEDAIAHRERYPRGRSGLDEVVYHAHLQAGRYQDAFEMYVAPADRRRFDVTFGDLVEYGPTVPEVGHRVVVPQGGPGDEILCAGLYGYLRERSGRLTALCEPRLETLLRRSFPGIDFRPVERRSSRTHPGFLEAGAPERVDGPLFDLIDLDSYHLAASADAVMPGRAMFAAALHSGELPFGPSLLPDEDLMRSARERFAADSPAVGLVWRSEYNSAMRSIHYLTLDELDELLGVDARIVCLQHDATVEERESLLSSTDGRAIFLDDIDMRDDFEAAAAIVAALDVVVGVGTTPVELAAAVGTPTVSLHPTHFSSWRSMDAAGRDFWHATTRIAAISEYTDRSECGRRAAALIRELPWE